MSKKLTITIPDCSAIEAKHRIIRKAPEIDPKLLDKEHFDAEFSKKRSGTYNVLIKLNNLLSDYEDYQNSLFYMPIDILPSVELAEKRILQIEEMQRYILAALYPPAQSDIKNEFYAKVSDRQDARKNTEEVM